VVTDEALLQQSDSNRGKEIDLIVTSYVAVVLRSTATRGSIFRHTFHRASDLYVWKYLRCVCDILSLKIRTLEDFSSAKTGL